MIPRWRLRTQGDRNARAMRTSLPVLAAAFALVQLALPMPASEAGAPDSGEAELACQPFLRRSLLKGRGDLIRPYRSAAHCLEDVYRGPRTRLYSDRPYHTEERVAALLGLRFCQSQRHGTHSWIIDVSQETEIHVLGTESYGLRDKGWRRLDTRVRVDAAGTDFDTLYAKTFPPGRYVIRQDFSRTAPLIFWRSEEVQILRLDAGTG